jgi:hypothetical protein
MRRQKKLYGIHFELAKCSAMWQMPEKSKEKSKETPSRNKKYGIARYVF